MVRGSELGSHCETVLGRTLLNDPAKTLVMTVARAFVVRLPPSSFSKMHVRLV
jgi:hypothetical protein